MKLCPKKKIYLESFKMVEKESVYESLIESAVRVLLRVVFVFEPLAPSAITTLMNLELHRFKDAGAIGDYKTKFKRLGKFHYRTEINLELTGMQAVHLGANLFPKQLRRFRRWVHD
jgi:hypothetical protein